MMNITAYYREFDEVTGNAMDMTPVVTLLGVESLDKAFMLLQGEFMPFRAGWAGRWTRKFGESEFYSFIPTSLSVGDWLVDTETGVIFSVAPVGFKEVN